MWWGSVRVALMKRFDWPVREVVADSAVEREAQADLRQPDER